MDLLSDAIQIMICPSCKSSHVQLQENKKGKMGFASEFVVVCSDAHCQFQYQFSSSKKTGHAFEVNRRSVLGARNIGVGRQGLVKFSAVMDMPPPMNSNAYTDTVKVIANAAEEVAQESMAKAASETKEYYEENEDDGTYHIGVSGDGTWRKRGFRSSVGAVAILSVTTGKVLDVEVMSKECRECMANKRQEGSQEFEEWWEGHQHKCHVNFFGSSGKMDPAGCLAIFQRSVEKHSLKYLEFLGDGDSKSHNTLESAKVYGQDKVAKLECVGHIQKRMGSRLRSLKKRFGKNKLSDGKTIGGRGRLTDKVIDDIQVYYGKAIRQNTSSCEAMKTAIMAIWNHMRSTDESPHHHLCPKGKDSWCKYQQDVANGTQLYKHDHPLPAAVAEEIKATFDALSAESLLKSCLHGGTQNQNESFNSLIWQRATKETHSGLPTVQLATNLAVGHFNDGASNIIKILNVLGIEPGHHCMATCRKNDENRLYFSKRQSSEQVKSRRRKIRNKRKGYSEALEEQEGPQYLSGAF